MKTRAFAGYATTTPYSPTQIALGRFSTYGRIKCRITGTGHTARWRLALPFEKTAETYSFCDLLSVPDLAAGSIQAMLVEEGKGTDARIRLQANSVLLWLAHQSVFLKKMTIHVRTNTKGQVEVGSTHFIPIEKQPLKPVEVGRTGKAVYRVLEKMQVKIALSHKYDRLSRNAGSDSKRRKFTTKARKYDRQASQLLWQGGGPEDEPEQ